MFTPSLLAMMAQGLLPGLGEREPRNFDANQIAEIFSMLVKEWRSRRSGRFPRIPVLGRTMHAATFSAELHEGIRLTDFPTQPYRYFFGRVGIDTLAARLAQRSDVGADQEIFDLGTPLHDSHAASGPRSTCQKLLPQSASVAPTVRVAVIDRGIPTPGIAPSTFSGKLTQVIATDISVSTHAENVLSVLLERLDHHNILAETEFSCALVAPPSGAGVGSRCFTHANSTDLLQAVQALDTHLGTGGLPVVLNLSLGTHVGPHNGQSPLEEFIRTTWSARNERYLHVAVGNDGGRGIANRCHLVQNVQETVLIRTGPKGGNDLLVELWWSDPKNAGPPDIDLDIFDGTGRPLGFKCSLGGRRSGSVMARVPAGFTGLACQSLFQAHAWGSMHCIALALNASSSSDMKNLEIVLSVKASTDTVLHAWIVISDDLRTCFVEGGSVGTVCVPATEPESLSVAGVEQNGQPWSASSRGPSAVYASLASGFTPTAPFVAHLVDLGFGNEKGTSYASPRACADAAVLVRDSAIRRRCSTAQDLANELVGKFGAPNSPFPLGWNNRTGFGSLI